MYLNIKNIRLSKKFSQKTLAKKAHISQSYLSKLERNDKLVVLGVRLKTIKNIAKALNVNENKILKFNKKD
ncbi:helix-turn-helix domain-containing protein [Clostridium perfringens]|uniref:helix-turn-helix domain-containing protein n=1 Tax=Clostridium perfringens TaxID=1502 RepID=UPI0018E4B935|nr:helix-turn-helix transcriptional regulator [Clostridium perfringens]MBI6052322.1 helix-turn-helix transcriptional regulator [Clostridium perfringens]MDK0850769.1 helix-turn-helix transcriptional regulator [Clostridium perfringens]